MRSHRRSELSRLRSWGNPLTLFCLERANACQLRHPAFPGLERPSLGTSSAETFAESRVVLSEKECGTPRRHRNCNGRDARALSSEPRRRGTGVPPVAISLHAVKAAIRPTPAQTAAPASEAERRLRRAGRRACRDSMPGRRAYFWRMAICARSSSPASRSADEVPGCPAGFWLSEQFVIPHTTASGAWRDARITANRQR